MKKKPAAKAAKVATGDDAWLAAKREMAARNDAARNRLEAERAPGRERDAARRRAIARQEMTDLPVQPRKP